MEQGLDMTKLRGMQKEIAKKAGKGDGNMVYSNKLPEEMDIKILPPPPEANGMYFVEQQGWWIDGKFYLSNSTPCLKGVDVIEEEIEDARDTGDESLLALINKKKNNIPIIKKETRYLIPFLQLEVTFAQDDSVESFKVVDDEGKILVAKPTLLMDLNKVITSRPFQNGTKFGAADRVKGAPIIIGKTGKGIDTTYTAIGWNQPLEMDEKYYTDKNNPNCFDLTRKMAKTDAYLRSVIRHYLYGEDLIEDEKKNNDSDPDSDDTKQSTPARGARPSKADEPKVEKKAPARPSAKKETASDDSGTEKPKAGSGRSLLGDAASMLDNLD